MTTFKGIVVAFEADMSQERAQVLVEAIRQLRGVADVQVAPTDFGDGMVRMRVHGEWTKKLGELVQEMRGY